ncbi:MAG: fumarylacetoacetate hydrolase family protein [Oscillospiraceae bacterium]|jgi:2-keto-4-pentenoate hydratase/2-oxohepta-3-ene-1,7-dioic acid hydratase in catechol pathway|nr:fumarylacetoacetate hydrolase family protein [Oscillospiraceae bacterium]
MRFARRSGESGVWCVDDGDRLSAISGGPGRGWERTGETFSPDGFEYAPPLEPGRTRQLVIVGWNYAEHTRETGSALPPEPMCYPLSPLALNAHLCDVVVPGRVSHVEHEAELVVVMGRRAKNVRAADALDYALGVTCGNDVSARDIQNKQGFSNLPRAKTIDTFKPVGPFLVTDIDFSDLPITMRVNGEVRQSSRTSAMLFGVPELIEFITSTTTLYPWDIIFTGTPNGCSRVKPGDVMEVSIEGVGSLVNTVVGG